MDQSQNTSQMGTDGPSQEGSTRVFYMVHPSVDTEVSSSLAWFPSIPAGSLPIFLWCCCVFVLKFWSLVRMHFCTKIPHYNICTLLFAYHLRLTLNKWEILLHRYRDRRVKASLRMISNCNAWSPMFGTPMIQQDPMKLRARRAGRGCTRPQHLSCLSSSNSEALKIFCLWKCLDSSNESIWKQN